MKKMKKLLAFLLALVMMISVMAGCTGNEDTQPSTDGTEGTQGTEGTTAPAVEDGPQYGGHADIRTTAKNEYIDPLKVTGVWGYQITTMVWENALTRDLENNIRPGVCDFEMSEDQLTVKLWVRDGMTFSNGDPVDIYDVEASYNRAFNVYSSIIKKVVPYVESMEVDEDGKTLVLKFTEWREDVYYYLFAYRTWCAVMPKEICEKYPTSDAYITTAEDAIGTGPYYVSDFELGVQVTVSKRDDYQVMESDYTGFAGPKYGYLDSVTFWTNRDDASASMALLAHDYDATECLTSDYQDMWESNGIKEIKLPSTTACDMYFNTFGLNNVCAKYPSLRKAIMAAIDYDEFLGVITDNQQELGGYPVLSPTYATDVFVNADYYGATNLEVAQKYLDAAKEEGYNMTDPVVVIGYDREDIGILIGSYIEPLGIPYKFEMMESGARNEFIEDHANIWDLYMRWPSYADTPTLTQDSVLYTYWNSPEKDALVEKMKSTMVVGSEEYMEAWKELAQLWVDDCAVPYMSDTYWFWYADEDLVTGDEDSRQRYWFNAYWVNPEEHQD